jgi:hypothetical protein
MGATRAVTRVPFAPLLSARNAGTLAAVWWPLSQFLAALVQRREPLYLAKQALFVVVSYGVARFAFAARSRFGMKARLALGNFLLSASVNALFLLETLRETPALGEASTTFAVTYLASALFFDGVFAGYAAVLAALVGKHAEAKTSENADRAQVAAAVWLLVGIVPALLRPFLRGTQEWKTLAVFLALNLVAPAAWAITALLRIRSRRRWLDKVSSGALSGWRLVEQSAPTPGLPQLVRVESGPTRTLVRVHDASQPFREAEGQEAVALVTLR